MKRVENEVTMSELPVGVFLAWMRRNVVSLDDPEGRTAPMYRFSFVKEEGRSKEIQSRACVLEVN